MTFSLLVDERSQVRRKIVGRERRVDVFGDVLAGPRVQRQFIAEVVRLHLRFVMFERMPAALDVFRRARFDLARIDDASASPIFVAVDGELAGILVCTDPLRPEAPGVVRALREPFVHVRGAAAVRLDVSVDPAVERR